MKMQKLRVSTEMMLGETDARYEAWKFYYRLGSYKKAYEGIQVLKEKEAGGNLNPILKDAIAHIDKAPGLTTLKNWGKKFNWAKRNELRLELFMMEQKANEFRKKSRFLITDLFRIILKKFTEQIEKGQIPTMEEVKMLWEMYRVESNLPNQYQKTTIDYSDPEKKEQAKDGE